MGGARGTRQPNHLPTPTTAPPYLHSLRQGSERPTPGPALELLPAVVLQRRVMILTWGHILVHPLEEAALLLSWLGACVELATLVGPILLHSQFDSGLAA